MQKKLIVPALIAMGFAGGTLPAPAYAQSRDGSQNQSQNQSENRSGGSQSDGAYQRYLRQLHQELMRENTGRQGGDGGSGSGGQGRQYGGQQSGNQQHGGQRSGSRQSSNQQSDREQFMRGYMAGRAEERRRREMSSSQGGGNQSGNQSGNSQGDGSQQSSQQSSQGSGQGSRGMYVIPNVYPDSARFQQFAVVPNYSRSMDHLLIAAQSLREAIQDLAQQPAGDRRNQAISEMQDALLETQQAMMRIPPDMR